MLLTLLVNANNISGEKKSFPFIRFTKGSFSVALIIGQTLPIKYLLIMLLLSFTFCDTLSLHF